MDYKGLKPYYIGIWFPIPKTAANLPMSYKDYFYFDDRQNLTSLRDSLIQMNRTSLVNYGLKHRMNSWEDREFESIYQQMFKDILNTKVNATETNSPVSGNFPLIVYHHGMGGTFEENSVLFEYLASHGYVIVSSNYHWPDQGVSIAEIQNDLKFVLNFASNLPFINQDQVYFLGHSWGAQVGLILNQQGDHQVKSFFLLDSTLELMPLDMVRRFYPHLDSIFRNHPNDFRTRSFIITSPKAYLENDQLIRQPLPKYEIFNLINSGNFNFLITRDILDHEAFVSKGILRAAFLKDYKQDDSTAISTQYLTYIKLNEQILILIQDGKIKSTSYLRKVKN